ncbi:MAG: HAD family phosphatase, partial [Planctomycetes bacterium]|nr:HAD family phosphatase [Planctomycetota bacterium]
MKAILFDHDGVLADSESAYFEATRAALATAGFPLQPQVWASRYLGEGKRSREIALGLGLNPELADALIAEREVRFARMLAEGIPLMPGVKETVAALRGRVRMALVTGCPKSSLDAIQKST